MTVGFVGAGAVGTALAVFLNSKGEAISGFYSLHFEHALKSAVASGSVGYDSIEKLVKDSDLIFLTVKDDSIVNVVDQLSSVESLKDKIIVHTSGALDSSLLSPLFDKGAACASIHPLQSFAQLEKSVNDLQKSYFSIEGSLPKFFWKWWEGLGLKTVVIESSQKTQYHLSAVIVSNFFVSVMSYGIRQMKSIGIEEEVAIEMLSPLIEGTYRNILTYGIDQALTGPIVRGDLNTIEKHIGVQSEKDFMLYSTLAGEAVEIALRRGLPQDTGAHIKKLMKAGGKHGHNDHEVDRNESTK